MSQSPQDRIFVALDTPDIEKAETWAGVLKGLVGGMKVGKEFFTAQGPAGVRRISELGMPVFLDLKFHDIPNTVAGAMRSAIPLGLKILNVHASGGKTMMETAINTAKEEAANQGVDRPLVFAVTVLTSMDRSDLAGIGVDAEPIDQVKRLARLTQDSGLDGVVCSAAEIEALRAESGPDFKLLTPGIRPAWSVAGDQKRVVTPADAVKRGSDFMVIGRPITGADDPAEAAKRITDELASA